MQVKANVGFSIKMPVRTASTQALKLSGTVNVVLARSNTDLVWSTASGGSYQTRAAATLPTATLEPSGELWEYDIPAAATNGLADMTDLDIIFTDNTTPASITAYSDSRHIQVRTDFPAIANGPVNLTAINGGSTAGNNATLSLAQLNIVNSGGDAIVASSTGANGNGVNASGNGTGNGIKALSGAGATGDGINAASAATSGHGVNAIGNGGGNGVFAQGGATGTGGSGINAAGHGTNGSGIQASGSQAGSGVNAIGGGTGHGILAAGGGTSGDGVHAFCNGVGNGIAALGTSTGHGIKALSGAGGTGDGINASAQSTNGNGLNVTGIGTGNGLLATGGGSGVPIKGSITGNLVGSVTGDVQGKVLGGGASTITAAGAWALDGAGNPLALASVLGTPSALAGGTATVAGMLASMAGAFATGDDLHAIKAAINAILVDVSPTDIAIAVWNELLSAHTIAGTMGKAMNDLENGVKTLSSISVVSIPKT